MKSFTASLVLFILTNTLSALDLPLLTFTDTQNKELTARVLSIEEESEKFIVKLSGDRLKNFETPIDSLPTKDIESQNGVKESTQL